MSASIVGKWHRWFAWRPVTPLLRDCTYCGRVYGIAWLRTVERRWVVTYHGKHSHATGRWEYREVPRG